jgi:hypothetical protein
VTRIFDLRRLFWVAVIAVAAVLATFTAAPEAQAQEQGSLHNRNDTKMCIGIDRGSKQDGALAILFRCDGRANQKYAFKRTSGGFFQLQAQHSKKCLRGAANLVTQEKCRQNDVFQNFRVLPVSGPFFSLQNKSGKCIGVSGGAPVSGALIVVFKCDGKKNQQWRL